MIDELAEHTRCTLLSLPQPLRREKHKMAVPRKKAERPGVRGLAASLRGANTRALSEFLREARMRLLSVDAACGQGRGETLGNGVALLLCGAAQGGGKEEEAQHREDDDELEDDEGPQFTPEAHAAEALQVEPGDATQKGHVRERPAFCHSRGRGVKPKARRGSKMGCRAFFTCQKQQCAVE